MKAIKHSIFPEPNMADEYGLLCIGGDLDVDTLIDAYSHGIFPWPQEGLPLLWFCPPERGILDFSKLHIPKRLKQFRQSWKGAFRINTSFTSVINACKEQFRPGQGETWILPEMVEAYIKLHKAGYAHCVEAWEEDELVAGIYGVYVRNVFSGESMFFKKSNCSKLCLWFLFDHLQKIGLKWIDIQMLTSVTEQFGGEYIARKDFLKRIGNEQEKIEIPFDKSK